MPKLPIPRAKRASDVVYNARRRLKRQAERLEKQASQTTGTESARLRALAETARNRAQATYGQSYTMKEAQNLLRKTASSLASASSETNTGIRTEEESISLMSTRVGSRILAATESLWRGVPYNQRLDAIMTAYGVTSVSDLITRFEELSGGTLYDDERPKERYDSIVLTIRKNSQETGVDL